MALIITDNQHCSNIASAIRTKLGTNETFAPAEMASAIMSISGGGEVTQDQDGYIVLPSDGGGGGGSSDFKTAKVTVITQDYYVGLYVDETEYSQYTSYFYAPSYNQDETVTYGFQNGVTVNDLYTRSEGTLIFHSDSVTLSAYGGRVSETGDVTYDESTQKYTVTGDCTITLYSID